MVQDLRTRVKTCGSREMGKVVCMWWKIDRACLWRDWFTWDVMSFVMERRRWWLDE